MNSTCDSVPSALFHLYWLFNLPNSPVKAVLLFPLSFQSRSYIREGVSAPKATQLSEFSIQSVQLGHIDSDRPSPTPRHRHKRRHSHRCRQWHRHRHRHKHKHRHNQSMCSCHSLVSAWLAGRVLSHAKETLVLVTSLNRSTYVIIISQEEGSLNPESGGKHPPNNGAVYCGAVWNL